MLGSIPSCALLGIDAFAVVIEVDVSRGMPGYHVVGLPATSVKEGAVRIRSALTHVGHSVSSQRITVNLAPADRRKEGAALDLPIAIGVLVAGEVATLDAVRGLLLMGELGLDGSLRPVRGALSAALLARDLGMRGVLLPWDSAREAAVVEDIEVYGARHLGEVLAALQGTAPLSRIPAGEPEERADEDASPGDMSDVRGQAAARAALEIAVAGGHNLLLTGPPGIGKTMLARRVPTILPPMSREEMLETTQIYSAVGLARGNLIRERPYRAPHHSISSAALLGGGSIPKPGEISLAHNGVLFLDELPEYQRAVIESLRQPLEDRCITVGRVHGTVTLPASFLLVAAANPCPCGFHGSKERVCTCGSRIHQRYLQRLSGPLLDRIDLRVYVQNVSLSELRSPAAAESSASIRARVVTARERQLTRLRPFGCRTNADMSMPAMRATCVLDGATERALARLVEVRRGMTARSIDRLIKVARTIADLTDRREIDRQCLYEAAAYRALDGVEDGGGGDASSSRSSRRGPQGSGAMDRPPSDSS